MYKLGKKYINGDRGDEALEILILRVYIYKKNFSIEQQQKSLERNHWYMATYIEFKSNSRHVSCCEKISPRKECLECQTIKFRYEKTLVEEIGRGRIRELECRESGILGRKNYFETSGKGVGGMKERRETGWKLDPFPSRITAVGWRKKSRGGRCNSAENSSFDRDICGHSTFIPYNEPGARVNESN